MLGCLPLAPPPHISATVQSVSPSIVQPRISPLVSSTRSDGQSTGWLADRAADVGAAIKRLPLTLEDDEVDVYQSPPIPFILFDEPAIDLSQISWPILTSPSVSLSFMNTCLTFIIFNQNT
jgi:hypothetical protein